MHTKITDAIAECGPGHPAHVTNKRNERIVAIRTGFEAGTFNLDFSDPKVDLRSEKNGSEICNVPADRAQETIGRFLNGTRASAIGQIVHTLANQKVRPAEIVKITPTRVQLTYELPVAGDVNTWRYQTKIGRYIYIGSY